MSWRWTWFTTTWGSRVEPIRPALRERQFIVLTYVAAAHLSLGITYQFSNYGFVGCCSGAVLHPSRKWVEDKRLHILWEWVLRDIKANQVHVCIL